MPRQVPHDFDIEKRVIGVVLSHRPSLDLVFSSLEGGDFYDGHHRALFLAAREVYIKNGNCDLGLVVSALGDSYHPVTIENALASGFSSRNVKSYADALRRWSEARSFLSKAHTLAALAESYDGKDLEEVQKAAVEVVNVVGSRSGEMESASLDEAVAEYCNRIFNPDATPRIKTGIRDLDWKLSGGGLHAGTLTFIGARRGTGKTAVGLHIADNALREGKNICWVSQEMTAEEVAGRLILARSKVPVAGVRTFDDIERATIFAAASEVRKERITIYDRPVSPEKLWALCRRWKALGKLDMLGVDYLQILRIERGDHEVQALGDAVVMLKEIAKENHVPVLCLAQCRREADRMENKDPRVYMSHFKGAGAIEEHADHALMMWPAANEPNILECELAKNRHGEKAAFSLRTDFHTMSFNAVLKSPPPGVGEEEAEQGIEEPVGPVVEQPSLHGMKGAPDD